MIETKDLTKVEKIPCELGYMKSCSVDSQDKFLYFCTSGGEVACYDI